MERRLQDQFEACKTEFRIRFETNIEPFPTIGETDPLTIFTFW